MKRCIGFPWVFGLAVSAAIGCGGGSGKNGDGGGNGEGPDGGGGGPCVNLECFQVQCTGGGTTSISGRVFAPNGTLPLYNVTVYVPNGTVQPLVDELVCDQCDNMLSGNPLVQTTTDTTGSFTLGDMPATTDVPLVIQVGRWRRQIILPDVPQCTDTQLTADQTRLPRVRTEGNIPRMALSTGGADALECLLRKIGLDDSEIGTMGGPERIHLYGGEDGTDSFQGGGNFADSTQLWASLESLSSYDVVLLSCEGNQNGGTKPQASRQALLDFTSAGGRVFASHWHNVWIESGPADWLPLAAWNFQDDLNDITADIDQSFDKGADLAQWLVNVGGSTTLGKIDITAAQHTVTGVDAQNAQRWIYLDDTANGTPSVQYFSYTTPVTAPEEDRCGRVVYSDIHVSSGDVSSPGDPFPSGCDTVDLTPQEKVLAFMLFDIASCIGPGIP
jgi:hypothetical protein